MRAETKIEKLMTKEEVADKLGCKVCTVDRLRREGHLRAVKWGRGARGYGYQPRVVLDFMQEGGTR